MSFAAANSGRFNRVRRRIATVAMVALVGVVGFHVIFGTNGMVVYQKKKAEHRQLDKEILSLEQENARLNQRIKDLRTDPKTIEKEAREQLRYARPGEVVYTLPEQTSKPTKSATAEKK